MELAFGPQRSLTFEARKMSPVLLWIIVELLSLARPCAHETWSLPPMLQPEPLILCVALFHHVSLFPCVSLELNMFNVVYLFSLCACWSMFGIVGLFFLCVCVSVHAVVLIPGSID